MTSGPSPLPPIFFSGFSSFGIDLIRGFREYYGPSRPALLSPLSTVCAAAASSTTHVTSSSPPDSDVDP